MATKYYTVTEELMLSLVEKNGKYEIGFHDSHIGYLGKVRLTR